MSEIKDNAAFLKTPKRRVLRALAGNGHRPETPGWRFFSIS
jgi:hypothetical protein